MKYFAPVLLIGIFTFSLLAPVAEAGYVNGYYRSNGTYVKGYYRTEADGNPYNNYSYPGNYNPNTGKVTGGNASTYLNNYYNTSSYLGNSVSGSSYSSYTPSYTSSYTYPTYTSSTYTPTTYTSSPTYSSAYYDALLKELEKSSKPEKKLTRSISWITKNWSEKNPNENCSDAPLTKSDKKSCKDYRKNSNSDKYIWTVSNSQDKEYRTCDKENYYYLNVCGKNEKFVCEGSEAYCIAK